MKTLSTIFAIILLAGSSFSVLAATEIKHSDMAAHQKIGSIDVTVKNGTISDVMELLSKAADEKGATYYRVTSLGMVGMGDNTRGTAEIYK